MKRARTGFTLIELLVVISIIALLISIMMPALSKARGKAMQIKCMSNYKQIVLSSVMYANDNKNYRPYISAGPGAYNFNQPGGWNDITWADALLYNEYATTIEQFACPTNQDFSRAGKAAFPNGTDATARWAFGHGINYTIEMYVIYDNNLEYCRIDNPVSANKVFFNEVNTEYRAYSYDPVASPGIFGLQPPEFRHEGQINAAYNDGHVKSLHYTDLTYTTHHPLLN